jgi:hypothetical protein
MVIAMSEVVAVEFESPNGEALRVEWPAEALSEQTGAGTGDRPWRLDGEIDWDEVEALRVLGAGLGDGRAVALAALRPAGAGGHGDELVAGVLVIDGEVEELAETLLSTEYGPDGLPRRVGLELYRPDDPVPLRVAADVQEAWAGRDGGLKNVRAALTVRRDGKAAPGRLEILTPA